MKKDFPSASVRVTLDQICAAVLLLIPAIIVASIVFLRPHWGLMDDATNIFWLIPQMRENGIFRHAWTYALGDLGWGMFRPTYPLMVYAIYWPGMAAAPWVTFLWNASLVIGVVWLYAFALSQVLKVSKPLLLIGSAAFFYGHDMLQHPSLQEKMVLFAGGLLVWLCWRRPSLSGVVFWAAALALIAFGAAAKAHFMIHYCVAVWVFLAALAPKLREGKLRAWLEFFCFAAIGVGLMATFAYIARHGGYTKNFSISKAPENLRSIHGLFLLGPVFLSFAYRSWNWRETLRSPQELAPAIGVLAFVTLFMSWGIGGYVQSVITPLYGALIVQLCLWYLRPLPAWVWIGGLVVLGIGVTTYRSYVNFTRLSDVGGIISSANELEAKGVKEIWMPCPEGAQSMERYLRAGTSGISVKELLPGGSVAGRVLLYDGALCPLPGRATFPDGCGSPEVLRPGTIAKSFRVVRCP